jgi:putative endonuclease
MKEHRYFVYLMASRRNGTLYVGVTSDLAARTGQHRDGALGGFTHKYGVHMLVGSRNTPTFTTPSAGRSRSRNGSVPGSWT